MRPSVTGKLRELFKSRALLVVKTHGLRVRLFGQDRLRPRPLRVAHDTPQDPLFLKGQYLRAAFAELFFKLSLAYSVPAPDKRFGYRDLYRRCGTFYVGVPFVEHRTQPVG